MKRSMVPYGGVSLKYSDITAYLEDLVSDLEEKTDMISKDL